MADASSSFGSGVVTDGVMTSFKGGGITATENITDLAIENGKGFFTVIDPETEASYATRSGNFKGVDEQGFLVTNQGFRDCGEPWEMDRLLGTSSFRMTQPFEVDLTQAMPILLELRSRAMDAS